MSSEKHEQKLGGGSSEPQMFKSMVFVAGAEEQYNDADDEHKDNGSTGSSKGDFVVVPDGTSAAVEDTKVSAVLSESQVKERINELSKFIENTSNETDSNYARAVIEKLQKAVTELCAKENTYSIDNKVATFNAAISKIYQDAYNELDDEGALKVIITAWISTVDVFSTPAKTDTKSAPVARQEPATPMQPNNSGFDTADNIPSPQKLVGRLEQLKFDEHYDHVNRVMQKAYAKQEELTDDDDDSFEDATTDSSVAKKLLAKLFALKTEFLSQSSKASIEVREAELIAGVKACYTEAAASLSQDSKFKSYLLTAFDSPKQSTPAFSVTLGRGKHRSGLETPGVQLSPINPLFSPPSTNSSTNHSLDLDSTVDSLEAELRRVRFTLQIGFLTKKMNEYRTEAKDGNDYQKALDATEKLIRKLNDAKEELLSRNSKKSGEDRLNKFKVVCHDAIKDARKELDNHRGFREVLAKILSAIVSILFVGVINIVSKRPFLGLFQPETDGTAKVNALEKDIFDISLRSR